MPEYAWTIIGVIAGALGGLSVKVRFDLNEWLRERQRRQQGKAQNLCTHTKVELDSNGDLQISSWFRNAPGTSNWICERCGRTTLSDQIAIDEMRRWAGNPRGYIAQENKYVKHLKKMGLF